jgi:CBS domain containing-hemolysin-like protein
MTTLILYFALALGVSFLCSLLEAVLLSISHAHVALLMEQERKSGYILFKFKEKIDHPLSAILTLNTIAHTVGAAGVGAQVQVIFGSQWLALSSGLLTFFILFFSEIIPKVLGAVHWKKLAPTAAYVITGLIYVTYPLVLMFEVLGRMLTPKERQARVTREEVEQAAEMGSQEGALLEKERRIITNLLHMHRIMAKDVMTPRSVIFALPKDMTVEQVLDEYAPMRFSRIPVYGKDLDEIVGMVLRYKLNQAYSKGDNDLEVEAMALPIHAVPMSKSVAEVLDEFIQRREHIFLVVDEYGGTAGLITLEDAIETLLGVEIVDELDHHEDMRIYARELWEKRRRKKDRNMF